MKNDIQQLTEVDKIKNRLKELFKLDEEFVVALNGEWGIGKTHFWDLFVENNLSEQQEKNEIAYVSLFGKDSLADIESDIIMQVSRVAKVKSYLDNSLGSIGLFGVKVSNVLSLIPKSSFKNIVICFDDFERKSNKLDSKDILGLISQFKEQKKCKIIMIYNQIKIENKEVLSDYKDKVIDYELHYKPTVAESYKAVSSKLKVFNDYPLEYLNSKGINNIRVIKRLINALNDFEFIESKIRDHKYIESKIVYSIMRLAVVNAQYSNFNLEVLIKYVEEKSLSKKNSFEVNSDYEQMLFLLDTTDEYFFINGTNDIRKNINYYIQNSLIDKESLSSIINKEIKIEDIDEISKKLNKIMYKYSYDLSYSRENFAKEMYKTLIEGGDSIVEIAHIESFIYYIKEIMKADTPTKYKTFALEKIKIYINSKFLENDTDHFIYDKLEVMIKFDASLDEYIKNKEYEIDLDKIKTITEVMELFNNPRQNGSCGTEPALLESIDKDTYKKYIRESPEFFMEVMSFIGWTKSFSGGSGFDKSVDIIIEALTELKEVSEYEVKIEKALKHLNIEI